jgi:hypothetical protein
MWIVCGTKVFEFAAFQWFLICLHSVLTQITHLQKKRNVIN